MKVAASADWQFDEFPNLSTTLPSGITSRLQAQIDCFEWYVDEAVKRSAQALVINGDIFDSRTTLSLAVIDRICRAVDTARESFGPENIHFVVGNHDSWLRSPRINSLQMFSGMATVHEEPTVVDGMAFVPWTDDYEEFADMIASVSNKKAKVLFTHCIVKGAVSGSAGLEKHLLKPQCFKRVLLGDVHDPLTIDDTIQYLGAPLQMNYGDAMKPRGFYMLDMARNTKLEYVENQHSPRFHIITDDAQFDDVSEGDFVRVDIEDPEEAEPLLAKANEVSDWVTSKSVVVDGEEAPRMAVSTATPDKDVLQRYLTAQDREEDEALLELGLDLLGEARA